MHQLVLSDLVATLWTVHVFVIRQFGNRHFSQAIDVDLVEAIRGLEHGHVVVFQFLLGYLFVAELTKTIFFLLLNLLVVCSRSLSLPHIHESLDGVRVEKLVLLLLDLIVVVKWVRRRG